jgi:hypothetical protein
MKGRPANEPLKLEDNFFILGSFALAHTNGTGMAILNIQLVLYPDSEMILIDRFKMTHLQ